MSGDLGSEVDFNFEAFDGMINNRGMEVLHEIGLPCPCMTVQTDQGAVGSAQPGCPECFGRGYIFRDPTYITALVGNMTFSRSFIEMGFIQPGDLSLSPLTNARTISDFDRITLTVGMSLDAQVIVRGQSSILTPRPPFLTAQEDLLYWESSDGDAIYLEDEDARVYTSGEYQLINRRIKWNVGAGPAVGKKYTIKYKAFPEYIAWTTPVYIWDRDRSVGQRVMLRRSVLDTNLAARQIKPPQFERAENNLQREMKPYDYQDSGRISTSPTRR